jgi:hypothetical protein
VRLCLYLGATPQQDKEQLQSHQVCKFQKDSNKLTIFLAIQCEFETDFCGFEVTGTDYFNFTIKQGEEVANADDGPQMDHTGNKDGHFAYILSGEGSSEGSQTEIETHMIHGANHLIECFQFWVAMKVNCPTTQLIYKRFTHNRKMAL